MECEFLGINGLQFMARDITFSNTAGPKKGQAVALRSGSDLSVFYRCAFQGYQDTLMVHSQRQFYRECYIYGTIDFIFGNAAVVFQKCTIYARRPLHGQANVITAQGRDDPNQNTGISIQNSRVLAAPDLKPVVKAFKTYLGRPWQQYSRTVVIKTYLDSLVHPTGWLTWGDTNFALNTLYYGEYMNYGPRSSTKWRVKWKGFHVISSANVASKFTVGSFIAGQSWLPSTGVPFTSGLWFSLIYIFTVIQFKFICLLLLCDFQYHIEIIQKYNIISPLNWFTNFVHGTSKRYNIYFWL